MAEIMAMPPVSSFLVEATTQLQTEIELIELALDCKIIDIYMKVDFVIGLSDSLEEVGKLVRGAPPGSDFHNNPWAFDQLVSILNDWLEKEVFSPDDPVAKALAILKERQ